MHLVLELIASMNANESDKRPQNPKIEIEMKKIDDKSSILSPITGFQTQNPFRKPLDSSPQVPVIKLHDF